MQEEWRPIDEFPGYSLSSFGAVRNDERDHIMALRPNHERVMMVNFSKDGQIHTRSVSKLMGDIFMEPDPRPHFDTPTNIDGDRTNNAVDNLMWRPLWFAVKYNRQFRYPNPYRFRVYIRCIETNEQFEDPLEAAMAFGLLASDISLDLTNQRGVFPGGYHFVDGDWK